MRVAPLFTCLEISECLLYIRSKNWYTMNNCEKEEVEEDNERFRDVS